MTAYTEDYFEILLSACHDAIVILENEDQIGKANTQFYSTFGVTSENLNGQSIFEITNGILNVPKLQQLIYNILPEDFGANDYKISVTNSKGRAIDFLINARKLPEANSETSILIFKVNSSETINQSANIDLAVAMDRKSAELQQSQSFLNSILNSSYYGIASYEPVRDENFGIIDFIVRYTNPEVPANLGLSVEDVTGKKCSEVYPGIFNNGIFERMVSCIKSGEPDHYEIDIFHNGNKIWLSAAIEKVSDSVTVTSKNITKEKEAAIFREGVNELLNNKNKELASFTSIASHDLQEPLRKIQMFISRIEENSSEFSASTAKYFNSISATANRMQNLISSLLSYSSMDSEDIKPSKTNLNTLLKEVLETVDNTLEEKSATIEREELPTVRVVSLQFHQVFSNILGNALKYSKPNIPPVIKIAAKKETVEGQNYWRISFEDNGIGFDPQYKEKIFEVFQRLHGKKEYVGTGVGLAICKKIVEKHNGFITAEGKPETGSVFSIYLPTKD